MKILVVDDSKAMRAIVKRALSGLYRVAGATIAEAADGQEALAAVEAEAPDLVLSDWNMPEMTGIELLRALNEAGITPTFRVRDLRIDPGDARTRQGARGPVPGEQAVHPRLARRSPVGRPVRSA